MPPIILRLRGTIPTHRQLAALGAWLALFALAPAPALAPAASSRPWSAPRVLAACSGPATPQIAFPARSPFAATGPGAIAYQACPSGALLAPMPGAGGAPRAVTGLLAPGAMQGATDGHLLLAGPLADGGSGLGDSGASAPAQPLGGLPVAAAHGYLGDVATAAGTGDGIVVRRQRWSQRTPGRPLSLRGGPGAGDALVAALDYRSDLLLVWSRRGSLFAREITVGGIVRPAARLGDAGPDPRPTAVISDDGRAIVSWSAGGRLELSISGPHIEFPGTPRSLGTVLGGPQIVRLAREAVVMLWTNGSGTLELSSLSTRGIVFTVALAAAPGSGARLLAVATGPRNELIALWSAYGGLAARRWQPTGAGPIEAVAAGDVPADAQVGLGIDPASDRATAVWRLPGAREPLMVASRG